MYKTAAIVFTALMIIFFLPGCGANQQTIQSEFASLITDTATAENIHVAADFLDENIDDLNESVATHMIIAYRDYLLNYIVQNKDKTTIQELGVFIDSETGYVDIEKIQASEYKSFYEDIKAGALMVINFEETPTLRVDYEKLLEKYGEYISEPVQSLYRLEALLIEKPASENATLQISWEELLTRAYAAEQLIKQYPDEDYLISDALWIYTTHLNTILMGTTNTPIFDYKTKEFSSAAEAAYRDFMLLRPDASLSWVLKEYFAYLNSIEYTLDFNNSTMSKVFFDTCDWLVSEAEKRVRE